MIKTYIIKRAPRVRDLNNLQARIHPIQRVRPPRDIPRRQSLLQLGLHRILQAQHPGARLVEVVHKADVEVGHVAAEPEVDVRQGGGVRAVDGEGAARGGPRGARAVCGFGDVGAWSK